MQAFFSIKFKYSTHLENIYEQICQNYYKKNINVFALQVNANPITKGKVGAHL